MARAKRRPRIAPPPEPLREARAYARVLGALATDAYREGLQAARGEFHMDALGEGEVPRLSDVQRLAAWARKLRPVWDRMVEANGEHWAELIPVSKGANGLTDAAWSQWIRANTDLITKLTDRARARARDTVSRAAAAGVSYRDLTTQIQSDLSIGKSRARLIARDQTLKASAQITEANHKAAGVTQFRWVANHDERTRPLHRELNGQIFSYPNGHPTEGIPGTHFQCRCFAYPVIPGVTDDPETAARVGGAITGTEGDKGQILPTPPG